MGGSRSLNLLIFYGTFATKSCSYILLISSWYGCANSCISCYSKNFYGLDYASKIRGSNSV